MRGPSRSFDTGRLMVWGAVAALAVTFWVPWAAAHRTARVERRAETIGGALHAAVLAQQPLDLADPSQRTHLLATARALAVARGELVDDLAELADAPSGPELWLANKHFLFRVGVSPPPPGARAQQDSLPNLEVIAWPLQAPGPAHTAFCWPEGAEMAFSRNLQAGYVGRARAPAPAAGQRRGEETNQHPWSYRGDDDERWIVRRRPQSLSHASTRP